MHRFFAWILANHKSFLIATTLLSFLFFLWGINSWRFAYVGDVWPFYTFAKHILDSNYQINPFSFDGVYKQYSVLASFYQAFFLEIFGSSNAAWRLSNIILIVPLSFFYYKWLASTFDKKIAIISTLLLQFSFYLSNFFKIGYINPQALALFVMALYFAARSGMAPTKKHGFFLGVVLGLSFYVYIGPIFPLLIWPYLIHLFKSKTKSNIFPFFVVLFLTYLAMIAPIVSSMQTTNGPQTKTVFNKEFSDPSSILTNVGNNLFVFYKDFSLFYTHFVPFPYLDVISQGLSIIGIIIVIKYSRDKKYRHLLYVYLSTVIILGITNPYTIPPTSRGMMLVIFGFIFAAFGIIAVSKLRPIKESIIIPTICCIIGLNIYMGQFASFEKTGYTGMALIIKTLQQAHTGPQKDIVLLLSERPPINFYLQDLSTLQQAYGVTDVKITVIRPHTMTCEQIVHKKVIVFDYDIEAISRINTSNCKNYTKEVLSPKVMYF